MLLAILVYGIFFGVPFSIGFVLLILVHEMGHVMMLRYLGHPAGTPVFIPFVGALIGMKEEPKNAHDEALVAFAGPLAGTLGAQVLYIYANQTQSRFLMTLALTGFILNLFNLIPVSPLDGGRVATGISRWLWLPGLFLIGLMFIQVWNPLLLIVLFFGAARAFKSLFNRADEENPAYYTIPLRHRLMIASGYIGLMLFLGRMIGLSYQQLQ